MISPSKIVSLLVLFCYLFGGQISACTDQWETKENHACHEAHTDGDHHTSDEADHKHVGDQCCSFCHQCIHFPILIANSSLTIREDVLMSRDYNTSYNLDKPHLLVRAIFTPPKIS